MKFTIPFNMNAFLFAATRPTDKPALGMFVWGYRNNSPLVFIGIYKAYHQTHDSLFYTIELLDGGHIDVDGIVLIPGQFLPYVVTRDNKVHRVQSVGNNELMTTRCHKFSFDEVQPVLYHVCDEQRAKEPSEPELPNRVREEGACS